MRRCPTKASIQTSHGNSQIPHWLRRVQTQVTSFEDFDAFWGEGAYSATSISFAQSAFVPASVFAETGRISSTSCAFFSAATDFAN